MKGKTLLILLIFFLISGCGLFESEDKSITQEFLFEIQYVNFAWGFSHSGTYIDNKGNVYNFKFDSSKQFISHKKEWYTESELKGKYSINKKFVKRIDIDTIERKKELIKSAIQGSYSDTLDTGADMGKLTYSCYMIENNMYRKIILKAEGDMTYQIKTPGADSLIIWLKTINSN